MTEKMKFETKNLTQENIAKIGQLFPEVLTEAKDDNGTLKKAIDFDKLRQILSDKAIDNRETYDFTWVGKKQAILEAATPIRKTLRPCKEESVNWDTTQNLYIEGDNLDVLKLLQESYLGKVKMIYIDPPYNTGNDFIYRDDFAMSQEEYDESGERLDESGNRLVKNTDSNGRFHSDWCSMMYPRLKLARNLLTDDGVIFISIDDNEVENLKKICDEVFGLTNFIAIFPWRKRTAKSDVPYGVSQDYEWVLAFAKTNNFRASIEKQTRKYYETPDFPGRPWRIHDMTKQTTASERPNSYFTMVNPRNGQEFPCDPNRTWRITKDTFQKYYEANEIVFPGDYDFLKIKNPMARYFKDKDMEKDGENFGRVAISTKLPDDIGMSQDGTKEMKNLFNRIIFPFPKCSSFLEYFIKVSSKQEDIILDFFSGSATTAHAVMKLNAEDGGNRKFIMVQLPEECDKTSEAYKAGYKNICEIGKERIRRAAKQIKAEHPESNFDGGFRVFKLADSNMKDVYYNPAEYSQDLLDKMTSNIKEDRNDMDLLYGCMLEWGLPLSYPHTSEKVGSYTIHNVNNGDLMACFDENIPEDIIRHIAAKKPRGVVFRDAGFADSPAKINVGELFKLLSPDTKVKVI